MDASLLRCRTTLLSTGHSEPADVFRPASSATLHPSWAPPAAVATSLPLRGRVRRRWLRRFPDAGGSDRRHTRWMKRRTAAVGLVAWLGVLYLTRARGRILAWGATAAEAAERLPGDELLEAADGISTRVITIDAPTGSVWPWLAQMGPSPRGGAYTYDWIENLLGLDMHSVDRILPEFQHPALGDTIGFGKNRMRLERVEPEHVLAWRSEDGNWVWTFVLREQDQQTRLISRNRFRLPTLVARVGMLPMEPASLLMERKMLRGIKKRAEDLS